MLIEKREEKIKLRHKLISINTENNNKIIEKKRDQYIYI